MEYSRLRGELTFENFREASLRRLRAQCACKTIVVFLHYASTQSPCAAGRDGGLKICIRGVRVWSPWLGTANTLQHTATHCNTLQHTASRCNTLQKTATQCDTVTSVCMWVMRRCERCERSQNPTPLTKHWNTLQHIAAHCSTLQHTATRCNTLQHAATHCNTITSA